MKTLIRGALLGSFLLLGCSARAQTAGDQPRTLRIAGGDRSYLVHVPVDMPATLHPLLLVFHGGGGTAHGMVRFTHLDEVADRTGMIVVYPQGVDRHWNDGRSTIRNKVDDVAFVRAMIDAVERDHAVDPARVYAAGISNGGIFVERLACDLSDRIAGIAAVAGTLAQDYASRCQPSRPVSVVQFDGTTDPIMPYAGGKVADFGGHGEGGLVLSVDATTSFWARRNACGGPGVSQTLPMRARFDPTRVKATQWRDCRDGSAVALYRIEGGGHAWPGGQQYLPKIFIGLASRQMDASETMVQFFLDHPRRGPRG